MGLLRRTEVLRSYQRGSWAVGSKHQKHQMMNPVPFLYRIPGKRGPGPFTMKYWWTLGCFPSGREVPFRLHEFLASYQQEHVPLEVEDWIQYFIKDPVDDLLPALSKVQTMLAALPLPDETIVGYKAPEPSVARLAEPVAALERSLMVQIPMTAVRAVASNRKLKALLLDEMYDYAELVRESGSTPHRRAGRNELTSRQQPESFGLVLPVEDPVDLLPDGRPNALVTRAVPNPNLGRQVGHAFDISSEETAPDERRLIRMLTTFAQGSMLKGKPADAASLMSQALMFTHDDDVRGTVHANVASAYIGNGQYEDAAFHGQEAALMKKSKGFANWATAVAYMDDFERAEAILEDALTVHKDDPQLIATQSAVRDLASRSPAVPPQLRGKTMRSPVQQHQQLVQGKGRSFMNEFDFVEFNKKMYAPKLNPSTNDLGSDFRRVGDLGGHVSTSRSEEKL